MYILLAIFLALIFILTILFVLNKRKGLQQASEKRTNRRNAYRVHVKNTTCNIQPLFSSSKQVAIMRDISASGMRIETKSDSLNEKSLLLIYFHLEEETFIVEGIVKRKQISTPHSTQYGVKFINITASMEESLHKKLWSINKKIAQ